MISNDQTVYLYCDNAGNIVDEFPTNPNGSMYNLAAVCNPQGNVMAMMPHPERSDKGDVVFSSMKEFIEQGNPVTEHSLSCEWAHYEVAEYNSNGSTTEWVIDMIINDNEAASVEGTLNKLGFDVEVTRQTHWEIGTKNHAASTLQKVKASGELYNSNKEFISQIPKEDSSATVLVRQKDDIHARSKFESLTERFEINEINYLKRGVVWNLKVKSGILEGVLGEILETHIFFNPISHECYRIH